jgi:hypothetical protein
MKKLPTLLEWLKAASEERIMQLTGYNTTDAYTFAVNLKSFGLLAFDILPASQQYFILSQFVTIYRP